MQELEESVEASRVGVRALANHRAALANEAAACEAQAAVARRRIPELEADKKTAAAARVSRAHDPESLHALLLHAAAACTAGHTLHYVRSVMAAWLRSFT